MAHKETEKPTLKLKSGFYQQYRYGRKGAGGTPLPRLNENTWLLVKSIAQKIAKYLYYIVLFFMCSVGVTALLNATIRQILLESLFGVGS